MTIEKKDTKYILDTNIFIQAYRNYYAFDICPGFWDFISEKTREGVIFSIDWVRKELKTGDDLDIWISKQVSNSAFLKSDDPKTLQKYAEIMQSVQESVKYNGPAKAEFATKADGWLVAYAAANGYKLVTQEVFDEFIKKKVPIPNLCREFHVDYLGTFELLRELKTSFHLL